MKKIIALLVSFILILSNIHVVLADTFGSMTNFKKCRTYTDGQFSDVSTEDWFAENVKKAYELGLVSGTSETTFEPDSNLNVAEVITLTSRIHDIYYGNNHNFENATPWYQSYLNYAYNNFLANNFLGAEFAEDDHQEPFVPFYGTNYEQEVTRGHFALFLSWALPSEEFDIINNIPYDAIPDVKGGEYCNAIYLLYNAGILSGSDEYGTFNPDSPITRSEVAAIITRVVDKSLRKEFKLSTTADLIQGTWSSVKQSSWNSKENKYDETRTEIVIEGNCFNEYSISDGNYGSSSHKSGTIYFSEDGKTLNVLSTEYVQFTDGSCKVSYVDDSFNIAEINEDKLILKEGFGGYTFTYEYTKGEIDGLQEECLSYVYELLPLLPSDFYVNKDYYPMVRTLQSITGAQCSTSSDTLSTDFKKGYDIGHEVYTYDFPMYAKTNVEAYDKYFKPYIDYLDNKLGLEKFKVTGSEFLAPFKDVSHIYILNNAQYNRMSVSWNLHELTDTVTIMIMFLKS